jgi:phospholipid/cholesterol/gamma-HCH transport system substrate-binding protein
MAIKGRNELKAGAFIVITFVLAVAVIIWIRDTTMGTMQLRTVSFKLSDDLGGLQVGDDVRLGGYKVGIVREIRPEGLDGKDPRLVVKFSLPAVYVLHPNAIVGVQTTLTGTTDLNITSVGSGGTLSDGQAIAGRPDPKTALFASLGGMGPRLENTLTQIETQTVPRVNQAVDSVHTLITHADSKLDPIVERYNKVADNASAAAGQVNDLLGDTKPDIRGTMKNLNAASGTIKDKLPALVDQITGVINKVDTSLTTAQAALLDVKQTAANAKDLTGSLREVIVDNRGKLDGIVSGIKTTSDNLKAASVEIRHSPWRLFYKPTPAEAANLNLYDSAREFSDGAQSLSDAATALRDAMHDPKADRAQIQKLVNNLDMSFNQFHQVENKLWSAAK